MNTNGAIISTVDSLLNLLNDFKLVLEMEQRALLELTQDHVTTVASRKEDILRKINRVHPDLLHRVRDTSEIHDIDHPIEQVRQLIETCKQHNRDNGALVAQGLKMCRNSIGFLRNNMNDLSVELYDPNGHTQSGLVSRNIGEA